MSEAVTARTLRFIVAMSLIVGLTVLNVGLIAADASDLRWIVVQLAATAVTLLAIARFAQTEGEK